MILNIIENHDLRCTGWGSADYYHLMTEAIKLAFADRDRWVTDPETVAIPYERLLAKEYARQRYGKIDFVRPATEEEIQPGIDAGDTVYLCAVETEGLAVSLIQSIYFEFGSAFMPPGTGILLQNRGSFFSLDPGHVNALAPRKRTFHTLIPAMALKDGQPVLVFGTMGGEGQPQTQTALFTNMVDFGFNVQEAIEAPRWLYGRTWGEVSKSLRLEGRISDTVADELMRRGYEVQMVTDWSQTMGHAQAIWIDHAEGVLHGGADPRGDGLALGR
jgi:gamma-glutamyltranspeptidase/glutathione hydrolase